jgi:hypothetical protein
MAEAQNLGQEHESHGPRHELNTVSLRAIIVCGGALVALALVSLVLMWGIFDYFAARQARSAVPPAPLAGARQLPPEPRLQIQPAQDVQALREEERTILHSYGWVDATAGIVRIPIDRAIEVLAERGLPVRGEATKAQ